MKKPHILKATGGKRTQRFPKEWRDAKNPFPRLKEYWYQRYVRDHPDEFGFTSLDGPFDTGPDFTGILNGRSVSVEVERDYISYLSHGHPLFDVLIVGITDAPHPDMMPRLPEIIMILDPQKVMDWSKPAREDYRNEMEARRVTLFQDLESAEKDPLVKRIEVKHEQVLVEYKEVRDCTCGGLMLETDYAPGFDEEYTEGQIADYYGGFWRVFECTKCGHSQPFSIC